MEQLSHIVEYHDASCIYRYNRDTQVLQITGEPDGAKSTVHRLRREGWLPRTLRAIWFRGDIPFLLVGVSLTIYLATKTSPKPPKPTRSFTDIVQAQ